MNLMQGHNLRLTLLILFLSTPMLLFAGGGVQIAATSYPLSFMAEQVAGSEAEVIQLIPNGIDPHEFRPTPKKIKALFNADVVLYNSEMMEPWVERLSTELENKKIHLMKVGAWFSLQNTGMESEEQDHHQHQGAFDPHFWLDPKKMTILAERFAKYLGSLPEIEGQTIEKNLQVFKLKLAELHQAWEKGLQHCKGKHILVDHDAFGHLAGRYHFTTHAIRGLSPTERPGPKKLVKLTELAKRYQMPVIFYEDLVSPKFSKLLAERVGVKVLLLHPIGSLTKRQVAEGQDYFDLMQENLTQIQEALQCK